MVAAIIPELWLLNDLDSALMPDYFRPEEEALARAVVDGVGDWPSRRRPRKEQP